MALPPSRDLLPPHAPASVGGFDVLAVAGEGGMGTVYRARAGDTGELVALKVLSPRGRGDVERFEREAQVLAGLTHPHIVRYVRHGLDEVGLPYLAMEWLDGEDLSTRLLRGPLTVDETVDLALGVAGALGEAHRNGIVHRDVKPSNVFLVGGDVANARVLDFGVARLAGAAAMTGTGAVLGTPAYMAPEQARGHRELGPTVDVFALGAVLHECLTGAPAFQGDGIMAILARVLLEPSLPPSRWAAVPPEIDALVLAMLAKDPSHRPRDGHAVRAALVEGAQHLQAPPESAFGAAEREWVTLVFARDPSHVETGEADTLVAGREDTTTRLAERARSLGATVARLIDGTVVAQVARQGSPKDRALAAGRCALEIRRELGAVGRVVVATGRGVKGARAPLGEVIDVAARLLALPPTPSGPRVDATTAGMLATSFEIAGDAESLALAAELLADEVPRTLLGRPAPFVGREREMATVLGLVEEAISEGSSRAVVLTAPAGTGKSRLRREVLARVAQGEASVTTILARCDALGAGSPHGLLSKLVTGIAGLRDGEAVEVTQQKLLSLAGKHLGASDVRRVAAFLAELVGAPFAGDFVPELEGARRDPVAMGDQVQAAWEDLLLAEASRGPLLAVIEDLHWGDQATVKAIDRALRRLRERPFVVLATARPEVHETFPGLWAERDMHEVAVVPLSRKASERLVRTVLGDATSEDDVRRLTTRAEGNPFLLEELLRAHAAGVTDVPEAALAVIAARLSALPDDVRRVLRAASVYGETFWQGAIEGLAGGGDVGACLERLVDAEIVEPSTGSRFGGERELRFRHALLRDGAYATLTDQDARLGHAHAAAWLSSHGERDHAVLAEHHDRAGDRAAAAKHHLRAAENGLEGNDLHAAIRHATRALVPEAEPTDRALAHEILADAHQSLADFAKAIEEGTEALALATGGSTSFYRAALSLAIAYQRTGRFEALAGVHAAAIAATPEPGAELAQLETLTRIGMRLYYYGRVDTAAATLDAADASTARGPLAEAWRHLNAATRAAIAGDFPSFLDLLARSGDALAAAGKLRDALSQWQDQCWWLANIGEGEEGLSLAERLIAEAQRIGMRRLETHLRLAKTWALSSLGRSDEGIGSVDELLRDADEDEAHTFRLFRLWFLIDAARWGAARAALDEVDPLRLTPSYRKELFGAAAQVYAVLGERERHREVADKVEGHADGNAFLYLGALWRLAESYVVLGDATRAAEVVDLGVKHSEETLRGYTDLARRARSVERAHGIGGLTALARRLGRRVPFAPS